MAKKKDISIAQKLTLTDKDLRRYEAGEMTTQEMHRVEKILLDQPFYAAAAEGFSEIKKDKVSTDKNLIDLKARLGNRINQPANKPAPVFTISHIWKPVSMAAALILVFTGVYYLIVDNQKETDTALMEVSKVSTDNLSEPGAASAPIAKEDKTDFKKAEKVPQLAEKQKQAYQNSNQAQAIVKELLPPAQEEFENSVIAKNKELDKTVTEIPPSATVAAPAPMVIEKKAIADREVAPVENRPSGGAGRLAGAAITGTVVNGDNEPMKDVTINISGRADGVRTDEEGKFSLKDARRGDIIVFNSAIMPQMEIALNNLPSKIVYSEQNIHLPNKPKVSISSPNEVMFGNVSTKPKPEFGWEAFDVYLKENTKLPPKAQQANIEGRVIVNFSVNEKGELSGFTIIRSLGYGCDEEAIRIIKNGPKWFPATKDDKPVSSSEQVLIKFKK